MTALQHHIRYASEKSSHASHSQDEARRVVRFRDAVEGAQGWLVLDRSDNPLAAGGLRIQLGVSVELLKRLAAAMTRKQQLLGLGVDGAKCGLDYDPAAPGKQALMRRFLRFLRPYLLDRYSMGPDMGTRWPEIEAAARDVDVRSAKIAIAKAQSLPEPEFFARLALLDSAIDGFTLGARRAGHGLATVVLATLDEIAVPVGRARIGIQGFGSLGRGAALALEEAGARVVAVSDLAGTLWENSGLDVRRLLAGGNAQSPAWNMPGDALLSLPMDLLVLAATEDAVTMEQAARLPVRAVVVGANLGLLPSVEALLHDRGIVVLPDFVGGCGGPASMDALFGPAERPAPVGVLARVTCVVRPLADRILEEARLAKCTPRVVAIEICRERARRHPHRPYGPRDPHLMPDGAPAWGCDGD